MAYVIQRDRLKPPTATKGTILKFLSLGLTFLLIPVLFAVVDPVLIIAKFMTRLSNGSEFHNLLMKELDIVHVSTYLFNVTNRDDFLSGKDDKLKVEEVGPFTYSELRRNIDMEFDTKEGVVRYTPHVRAAFLPEESIGDPKDYPVIVPNLALLSLTSLVSGYPVWTRIGYHLLVQKTNSRSFVELDAHSFFWGYDEPIISIGNTFMPGWITFRTLGIMDRLYDKKSLHRVEVGTTTANKFKIKTVDGYGGLTVWNFDDPSKRTYCNSFKDSYEGLAFPPNLTPETPLRIYRNVLCRMLDLEFMGEETMDYGGETFVYKLKNSTFAKNQDNDCLCEHGVCLEGVSDLSPCFYNLPFVMSNPHFLDAKPTLYNKVDGMKPDSQKHGTQFNIDPKIGVVVNTKLGIQLNMNLGDLDFNTDTKPLSNMMLPVAYFLIKTPKMQDVQKEKMMLIYKTGPKVTLAVIIVLCSVGLLILSYSIRLMYWNWLCSDGKGIAFQVLQDGKVSSVVIPLVGCEDT